MPACVPVEGGLLGSNVDGFSDTSLEPAVVSIEDTSLFKVYLMSRCFEVNMLSNLRFLDHALSFVFREPSPEIPISLAYVKFLTRSVTSTARDVIHCTSDITFE